ncbi:BNR-4 repeat-containing protein [Lentisphaera profundi]|uniref:BNR-4 repeat-containing protein n=1 Tax=Lentisphaera profundi TaxID=1658616 RepID=A0ABY7VUG3_9BACT|nr:BNR-4 repeat-containing protein [Lentisphaera profundi]WDE97399.1 BNR-4 repeat-containing protein [Lentisphaera profundi]
MKQKIIISTLAFTLLLLLNSCTNKSYTPISYSSGIISPWDTQQVELEKEVKMPVEYPQVFSRESSLFGYNPRFMPASVTFTKANRPVMRFGLEGELGEYHTPLGQRSYKEKNFIQYLGNDGRWYTTESHVEAVREYLKLKASQKLEIHTGNRSYQRVEFDLDGHAYTMIKCLANKKSYMFLLYSADEMKSWQVIEPAEHGDWRIESYQTHNLSAKPPVLVAPARSKSEILLLIPQKKNGKISLTHSVKIPVGKQIGLHGTMAGAGNSSISLEGKTYITYYSTIAHATIAGTPQYIVSYDHKSGKIEGPVFLGVGGHRVDGHNSPVILADSKAHIHVLLGTHWHSMVHCVSKNPADISSWQEAVYVAGNGDNSWSRNGITYPGFTIDKDDTLHLVVRGRNSHWVKSDVGSERIMQGYPEHLDYALVYLRKKKNGLWEKRKDLVRPSHMAYSNWYHKISIDRHGMPYLTYMYYAHNLTKMEKEQYISKWGGTGENDAVSAHDPVLIRTSDCGDSWSIVRTPELFESMDKNH